jgi:2-polyprenyl-3-methyl-5-hydroxy-6-metoxy-1,4-benzoquinol methylase
MSEPSFESESWKKVTGMLGDQRKVLGQHWSYNLRNDPKRLGFVLSRYKFAAKMACKGKTVIEFGCSEGLGSSILGEFASGYTGVDSDASAIASAKENWESEKTHFLEGNILDGTYGKFDSLVCMDVIEHIHAQFENDFMAAVSRNLGEDGICVIGTPNITSAPYASAASQAGHVNLYSSDRLQKLLQTVFHNVFMFGMNDEILHTGYAPMAHFLIAMGCNKISGSR